MKPENAGENRTFRAETTKAKLKQDAQTQDADDMQAKSVLYMAQLKAISQQYHVLWVGGGLRHPASARFR